MLRIIDAQVHVWDESPIRPWPEGAVDWPFVHRRRNPMSVEEVLAAADEVGVDGVVVVPPSFAGDYNDVVADGARDHPDRILAFGRLPLDRSFDRTRIARQVEDFALSGLRFAFNQPAVRRALVEGELDALWATCEELDVPVMVLAPGLTDAIESMAGRFAGLRIAVDHLNLPGPQATAADMRAEVKNLHRLAKYSNVRVKASALPNYLPGAELAALAPVVYDAIELFGAERVFWGSDLSRLAVPYRDWLALFVDGLGTLTARERELVLGGAIARWLRLPRPVTSRGVRT